MAHRNHKSKWINTRVVLDWDTCEVVSCKGYWYDGPVALAHQQAAFDQAGFAFRNDDGSETGASYIADPDPALALDQNITLTIESGSGDNDYRLRFIISETGGGTSNNESYTLEWELNQSGTWNTLDTTTTNAVYGSATANYAQGDDTTQQLSSGTFVTDNNGCTESANSTTSQSFGANNDSEVEFMLTTRESSVSDGDIIRFRLAGVDTRTVAFAQVTIAITAPRNVVCATEGLSLTANPATVIGRPRIVTCATQALQFSFDPVIYSNEWYPTVLTQPVPTGVEWVGDFATNATLTFGDETYDPVDFIDDNVPVAGYGGGYKRDLNTGNVLNAGEWVTARWFVEPHLDGTNHAGFQLVFESTSFTSGARARFDSVTGAFDVLATDSSVTTANTEFRRSDDGWYELLLEVQVANGVEDIYSRFSPAWYDSADTPDTSLAATLAVGRGEIYRNTRIEDVPHGIEYNAPTAWPTTNQVVPSPDDFDGPDWQPSSVTVTSGFEGLIPGVLDAFEIEDSSTLNAGHITDLITYTSPVNAGDWRTVRIFIKKTDTVPAYFPSVEVGLFTSAPDEIFGFWVNPRTGEAADSNRPGSVNCTVVVRSAGVNDDWWEVLAEAQVATGGDTGENARFYPATHDFINQNYQNTGTGTIRIARFEIFEKSRITDVPLGHPYPESFQTSVSRAIKPPIEALQVASTGTVINPVGGNRTVNCTTGTLTLTDFDSTVNATRDVSGATQTLTLTDTDSTVTREHIVAGATQTLTLTDTDSTVNRTRTASGATQTLTLSDTDATVSKGINVNGVTATLTLTDTDSTVNRERGVAGATQTLTLTDTDATINRSRTVSGVTGTLTLTDTDASVNASRDVSGATQILTLTAQQGTVLRPVNRIVSCTTGGLTLTDFDATVNPTRNASGITQSITLSDFDATINRSRDVSGATQTLTITGQTASIFRGANRDVVCTVGSLTLTDNDSSINRTRGVSGAVQTLTLTDTDATITRNYRVDGATQTLTLTAQQGTVDRGTSAPRNVDCVTGTLALTDFDATVNPTRGVNGQTQTLNLTGQTASIDRSRVVAGATAGLTLTDTDSAINAERNAEGATQSLLLTGQTGQIDITRTVPGATAPIILTAQQGDVFKQRTVDGITPVLTLAAFQATVKPNRNFTSDTANLFLAAPRATVIRGNAPPEVLGSTFVRPVAQGVARSIGTPSPPNHLD